MSELVVASSRPRTSRDCFPSSPSSFPRRSPSNALSRHFFFQTPVLTRFPLSCSCACVPSGDRAHYWVLASPFSWCHGRPPVGLGPGGSRSAASGAESRGGTMLAIEGPILSPEAAVRGEGTLHQDIPVASAVSPLPPFQQGRRSRETTLSAEVCAVPVTSSLAATPSDTPVAEVARRQS